MTRGDYKGITEEWIEVHDLILSLDTNAYAQNDVLADSQEVTGVAIVEGGTVMLESIVLQDEDDNGRAIDLVFLDASQSIGTENSAVSITDANARKIIGHVSIAATDYFDMVANQQAVVKGIGLPMECAAGSTSLWVAAVFRDATGATYTASGIRLKLGFRQGM